MSTQRVTPLAISYQSATSWDAQILVGLDASYVPMLLADTEARKLRFAWASNDAYAVGYQAVCELQEALLMSIGDRLISEVRALREGTLTPTEARDPELDPYTLPLASLRDLSTQVTTIAGAVAQGGDTVLSELQAIRASLQAENNEEVLERLDTLILLLGAA